MIHGISIIPNLLANGKASVKPVHMSQLVSLYRFLSEMQGKHVLYMC